MTAAVLGGEAPEAVTLTPTVVPVYDPVRNITTVTDGPRTVTTFTGPPLTEAQIQDMMREPTRRDGAAPAGWMRPFAPRLPLPTAATPTQLNTTTDETMGRAESMGMAITDLDEAMEE